jgi:hypothetical protein
MRFATDARLALATLAAIAVDAAICVTAAFDPRDAETGAPVLFVAAEAAAVAPDRVLVVVVRPGQGPVVAALRLATMRRLVESDASDDGV